MVAIMGRMRSPVLFFAALFLPTLFALALLGARIAYTESRTFQFLAWNLFLAWIPLWTSLVALGTEGGRRRRWLALPLVCFWLLFFPNSPYILTDLIHLRPRHGVPLLVDSALLFTFALNGLMLGHLSLYFWHRRWRRSLGAVGGWVLVAGILFLAGYGVYIGRFLRFNSWDALLQPVSMITILLTDLFEPVRMKLRLGMIVCLGSVMLASYWMVYAMLELFPIPRARGR